MVRDIKTIKFTIFVKFLFFLFLFHLSFAQENIERQKQWFNNWLKDRDGYVLNYPEIKYKPLLYNAKGLYVKNKNTIFLSTKLDTSVLVHELTHAYQYAIMSDEDDYIDKVVMPCRLCISKSLKGYWLNPIEIHARIMELRFINNLTPCDIIVSLYLLKVPDDINLKQFFTKQEIIDLLNNLY
jgi:hypothetical protein